MTTWIRSPSEIPGRIQYMLAVDTTHAWISNTNQFTSVLSETQFNAEFSSLSSLSTGTLMRDMGKTLTLTNAAGLHIATLRRVQTVAGATTEGVPPNWDTDGQYYVSVWGADPLSAYTTTVVRTG